MIYLQFPCTERLKQNCSCWACLRSADTVHKPDSVHKPLPGSGTRAAGADIPLEPVGEGRPAAAQGPAVGEDSEAAAAVSSSV